MRTSPKKAVFLQLARIGKALAAPHRLELLDILSQGPRTVENLARETGMSVANTSQHLHVLRAAGLTEATKEGLFVSNRIAGQDVTDFYLALRRLAESRLAELHRISRDLLNDPTLVGPGERKTLVSRARRGEILLLDVRPPEEYAAAHLPYAVSIPLPELERRLARLPRTKEIIAYCRGPYCVLAVEAVQRLRARGFPAFRLDDGILEWRARGLPLLRTTKDQKRKEKRDVRA
jgi:rhodanese-related sulfurtransferase